MRASRRVAAAAGALVLVPSLLTGCGSDSSSGSGSSASSATSAQAAGHSGSEATETLDNGQTTTQDEVAEDPDIQPQCPETQQGHFEKAQFVLHSGLAIGALTHWIVTPAKQGSFNKGADGRTMAFVKAGAAALFVKHEVSEAYKDVKADPALCKAIGQPMANLGNSVKDAVDKAKHGDISAATGLATTAQQIMDGADANGAHITPDENADITGKGKK